MGRSISYRVALAAVAALAIAVPTPAAAQPLRDVELVTVLDRLTFDAGAPYDGLRLTVGVPDGGVLELREPAAALVTLDLADAEGKALADGLYAYELRGTVEGREVLLRSGFFSVRGGTFVPPTTEAPLARKDVVHADDVVVFGSLCVGFDCVNNEAFGFTTLKLKENNLRIELDDTSNSPFPTTDWQIRANEATAGGAGLFAIDDLDAATTPFMILASAPQNAVVVDAQGDVGFGTAVPILDLHVLDGNTPALRLEQDGSIGFDPQTWDVGGNELNFFVRDVTHGSKIPFRIQTDAPTHSLYIASTGSVGLGTNAPAARLDVAGSIAVSGTVDGRDVSADGATLDAHVGDFDNPHQVTAAQVGAEPAGALKSGIVPAAAFGGSPATATVTFATAYPPGTSYALLLTSVTSDAKTTHTPTVLAKDESGFTITLGNQDKDLVEVDWLARVVGE